MRIRYSDHWLKKQSKKKKDITSDKIEFAINNSQIIKDKYWKDALNAISRIPPSERSLKVVYKKIKDETFIITAYWLN
jgi:hypothetical protein